MLTHIDLFAGIGGFSLGFERAGIDTLAHVEIDTKCQQLLHSHWENHLILSDVCTTGKYNLPYADIITFGSPCQDLSIAGKRKGFADGTRSNLFFEAARIIREIEPRYAIWENVPGALSSHNGRDFQSVLACLLDTDVPMPKSGRWASAGMVRTGQKEIAWRFLDSQYFGVAQRRRRLFLIFCARDGSPSSILFEREGVCWNPPPRGKTGEGITTSTETCFGIDNELNTEREGIGTTIDDKIVATSWTLRQGKEGGGKGYLGSEEKAMTLGGQRQFVGVRRLTPTECERLQGFPDGWTSSFADGMRYKMLGNAVTVNVATWLGKRIMETTL